MSRKSKNERYHARTRFFERFGIHLKSYDIKRIVHLIQHNQYPSAGKQSLRVSRFLGNIMGHDCIIVYDKLRHEIITFMKPREVV